MYTCAGILRVQVMLLSGKAKVQYDPAIVTDTTAIVRALKSLGYGAQLLQASADEGRQTIHFEVSWLISHYVSPDFMMSHKSSSHPVLIA